MLTRLLGWFETADLCGYTVPVGRLSGPTRGVHPALYVRDELVVSPRKDHFALCYTIFEATNNNEVGCVAWGDLVKGRVKITANPWGLNASAHHRPWCEWVSAESFVFNAQFYDGERGHDYWLLLHLDLGVAPISAWKPGEDAWPALDLYESRLVFTPHDEFDPYSFFESASRKCLPAT